MADQPINGLPKKTTVADTDSLLMIGASEEYQIDYGKLADALLNKLTSKTFTLDQGIKTLIAALNELNSKKIKECKIRIHTKANQPIRITQENVVEIKGEFPQNDNYIPVVTGHASSNSCIENVFYDTPNWVIYSNLEQDVTIIFFDINSMF